MTRTREVSLQTLALLDQAETDIDRLMGSGQQLVTAAGGDGTGSARLESGHRA